MRTFTHMREMLITHVELSQKIDDLEAKYETHDEQLQLVSQVLKQLIETPKESTRQIGFRVNE